MYADGRGREPTRAEPRTHGRDDEHRAPRLLRSPPCHVWACSVTSCGMCKLTYSMRTLTSALL